MRQEAELFYFTCSECMRCLVEFRTVNFPLKQFLQFRVEYYSQCSYSFVQYATGND